MKLKTLFLLGATAVGASAQDPEIWSHEFGYDHGWRVGVHPRMLADVNGDGKAEPRTSTGTAFRTSSGSTTTAST